MHRHAPPPPLALLAGRQAPGPVEALGRNPNIQPGAFAGTWNALSRMRCSDCHGGDAFSAAGPHGSNEPHILKRPYDTSISGAAPGPDQLCFLCHSYDVYANPNASPALLGKMVDAALVVVQAGKTPFTFVQKAVEAVGREKVLGIVLNRVSLPDGTFEIGDVAAGSWRIERARAKWSSTRRSMRDRMSLCCSLSSPSR